MTEKTVPGKPAPVNPGCAVWITGYSGAGKSTLAVHLKDYLVEKGTRPIILDGDALREALGDFDYSEPGRLRLAKIYSELTKLLVLQGHVVLVATISMFDEIWQWNRENIPNYSMVYLRVEDSVLRSRNQKSLYSGSDNNSAKNVVGQDILKREPTSPDMTVENSESPEFGSIVESIFENYIKEHVNEAG